MDGWRAIAVAAVVMAHGIPAASALKYLRAFGVHGVFIFFGISGYLITTKLLAEEARGGINLREFYLRRVFRILPPAFAFLGAVAALGAIGLLQPMSWHELSTCAFFLQNYTPVFAGRTPYTFHFWSLAVEEHFYLMWPFLLAAMGSRRARRVVPVLALAIAGWRLWETQAHLLFPTMADNWNANRTDRVLDGLLWGCYLAISLQSPAVRRTLQRALSPTAWWALVGAYLANIALHTRWMTSIEVLLVPLLLAGTVLRPDTAVGRVLDSAPLKWVGRLSYSIYLWQMVFFVASFRAPAWPQLFPLNVVFTLAVAWASYRFVELPCIELGRGVTAALRNRAPARKAEVALAAAPADPVAPSPRPEVGGGAGQNRLVTHGLAAAEPLFGDQHPGAAGSEPRPRQPESPRPTPADPGQDQPPSTLRT